MKSFSALIAKLLQPLNFLTLSNGQNPAKPRHRPFEQSLFFVTFCCQFIINLLGCRIRGIQNPKKCEKVLSSSSDYAGSLISSLLPSSSSAVSQFRGIFRWERREGEKGKRTKLFFSGKEKKVFLSEKTFSLSALKEGRPFYTRREKRVNSRRR